MTPQYINSKARKLSNFSTTKVRIKFHQKNYEKI